VNEESTPPTRKAATIFHNFVAKCLFLTKRARPNISIAVAFLTTRVKGPDEDANNALSVWNYYNAPLFYALTLSLSQIGGSMAHMLHIPIAMRGHTGGCRSLGDGMPINTSTKQKINTQSSTKTELLAANDFMPIIVWTNYFLEAQGYGHRDTIL
jgi:hypothetical protein